jgi:hypothetical protein
MRSLLLAGLVLISGLAQAQDGPAVHSYPVPGHGVLKLTVPAKWTESVRGEPGMPPTIELVSDDGKVLLQVTALWSPKADPKFNTADQLRLAVGRAAEMMQDGAVEKKLVVRPLKTSGGEGSYFTATDRAPGAGEYEYLANGEVPAGTLLLSFTALSHVAPPAGVEQALAVVTSAVQEP